MHTVNLAELWIRLEDRQPQLPGSRSAASL